MEQAPSPKSRPTLVRDVSPPPQANAEMVNNIPVQSPVSQVFKSSDAQAQPPAGDKDLDYILKDVNSSVKQAETPAAAKTKATTPKAPGGQSKPILATAAACLVAVALIAAAVMAYR